MKIPLTKYGWPQVAAFPVIILAAMIFIALFAIKLLPPWAVLFFELILALLLIWSISFFRDPSRNCPSDENLLLSPADGKITEIETVERKEFLGAPAIKIGIFLSIFNVHINRAPCSVRVKKIVYKKGQYKNAMNPESGRVNESNELQLIRTANPTDKLIVKQISGAIARRIVCRTSPGEELKGGEKFGMIKFGSRTELYVPVPADTGDLNPDISGSSSRTKDDTQRNQYQVTCLVKKGDKVKAGLTPLVRYEKCRD
ncbi:MAG: phosphatidylserine decarboxylase family protein [Sedimentisphaerales bacterium]|nr:phosphatidylserine decarboxylase family protein [Sedimentisphaerales bacterium]